MDYREVVLTKIAKQLEEKFGPGKPSVYEYCDYERNKEQIVESIKKAKHFNEKDFPGSEKILLKDIEVNPSSSFDDTSSKDEETSRQLDKYDQKIQ